MASTIKGITVEIGGNTQPLEKSLKNVNKTSRELSSELRVIDKLLKLDPTNTTLLAQKQKVLAESISNTEKKLKDLKTAQEQAQAQLNRGEIGEDQYRALERQVVETENSLEELKAEAKEVDSAIEQVGNESKEAAGKIGDFGTETRKATSESNEFSAKTVAVFAAVTAAVTAAIAKIGEIVGKMKEAATAAAAYSDDINTMAAQYRVSTESLQKFAYAADIVDVSVETFGSSLGRLTRNIGNAQKGTKDQVEAFQALGISIYDSNGKLRDTEDVFYDVIDALGKMEDETQADVYASRLFGRSFQDLNPLVAAGTDKLRALGDEAQAVGAVMGQDSLDSLNAFQDSLDRMKSLTEVATRAFSVGMAPALDRIAISLNEKLASPSTQQKLEKIGRTIGDVAEGFMNFAMLIVDNGEVIVKVIASIAAGFAAWKIAGIIGNIVSAIQAFAKKFAESGFSIITTIKTINKASMATIIGAIVAVIGVVASLAEAFLGASEEAQNFKSEAETLYDTAQSISENYRGTAEILAANATEARALAGEIQELDAKIKNGNLSASDLAKAQGELQAKTVQYNAAVGEEVLKIDAATGAIVGSTAALGDNTEALIENARKAAEIKALEDAFTAQNDALGDIASGLQELQKIYPNLNKEQQGYIDKLNSADIGSQEFNDALMDLYDSLGRQADGTYGVVEAFRLLGMSTNQTNNEAATLVEGLDKLVAAYIQSGGDVKRFSDMVAESAGTTQEATTAINEQGEAVAGLGEQEAILLMQRIANGEELSQTDADNLATWKSNNEERAKILEESVKREMELQNARVEAATDANDRIKLSDQTSLTEAAKNIEENTKVVEQYTADLDYLYGKIPDTVHTYLEEAGVDQARIVSEMRKDMETGGGEIAQRFVDAYLAALQAGKSPAEAEAIALGDTTDAGVGKGLDNGQAATNAAEAEIKDIKGTMQSAIGVAGFETDGMNIAASIARGLSRARSQIYDVVDQIVDTIKAKFSINVTATATGSGAQLRGFATGGVVWNEEVVRVAERGPEAIIPLDRLGGIVNGLLRNQNSTGIGTSSTVYFQPKIEFHTQKVTDAEAMRLTKIIGREFAKATGGRMS